MVEAKGFYLNPGHRDEICVVDGQMDGWMDG